MIYQGTWRDKEKVKGWVEPFSYVIAITQLAGPSPSQIDPNQASNIAE